MIELSLAVNVRQLPEGQGQPPGYENRIWGLSSEVFNINSAENKEMRVAVKNEIARLLQVRPSFLQSFSVYVSLIGFASYLYLLGTPQVPEVEAEAPLAAAPSVFSAVLNARVPSQLDILNSRPARRLQELQVDGTGRVQASSGASGDPTQPNVTESRRLQTIGGVPYHKLGITVRLPGGGWQSAEAIGRIMHGVASLEWLQFVEVFDVTRFGSEWKLLYP